MKIKRKKRLIEFKVYNDQAAELDIYQINNYIKYKLYNPIAANNITNGLRKSISILRQFPYIGKIYNQENDSIRFIIYKKYLIFYEIQEKERIVIIKTIIYGKRNREVFLWFMMLNSFCGHLQKVLFYIDID